MFLSRWTWRGNAPCRAARSCYHDEPCSADDRLFQIVAFRTFSKTATWRAVRDVLGRYPVLDDLADGSFTGVLDQARQDNGGLYTGAFILCATDAYGQLDARSDARSAEPCTTSSRRRLSRRSGLTWEAARAGSARTASPRWPAPATTGSTGNRSRPYARSSCSASGKAHPPSCLPGKIRRFQALLRIPAPRRPARDLLHRFLSRN